MAHWSPQELQEILVAHCEGPPNAVGVGERAYPRFGPALFTPDYAILCSLNTGDLAEMKDKARVVCLQERFLENSPPRDTQSILSHPVPEMLPAGGRLLLYRQTDAIQRMADARRWHVLANPPQLRLPWDNKAVFRRRLMEMGLAALQFESVELESLSPERCSALMRRWGSPLVIQIPCFPRGGGRSSFLLQEPGEVKLLRCAWKQGTHMGHSFKEVMISPWVPGPSLSMEGCVTPRGVLVSPLQLQLVDIEEVLPPGGMGRFCGHQWGGEWRWERWAEPMARSITVKVGQAMAREGYRGIFGLDFVLDMERETLWVLECNPRYTGAFPTLTLLQWERGLVPLEFFHVLSFMRTDPGQIPTWAVELTSYPVGPAAQLLLFHRDPWEAQVGRTLPSGRYLWNPQESKAERLGPALPFPQLPVSNNEFLILDGPPPLGHRIRPARELERLLRLVFFKRITGEDPRHLLPEVAQVVRWIYRSLGLERCWDGL